MRVLFFNRDPSLWQGGDMVQMDNTMNALRKLGVECSFEYVVPSLVAYDAVHIMHINFDWTKAIAEQCLKDHKPYFISAIFYPFEYALTFKEMERYINLSSGVICLSEAEKKELIGQTHCNPELVHVIPNGVDTALFTRGRVEGKRAITLARVSPEKGLIYAAKACKALNIPYVIAGEIKSDVYAQALKEQGAVLLGKLDEHQVVEELHNSSIYICTSTSERQSLGVLEAAACGLPVVDSIFNRGSSLLPSSEVVNPFSERELNSAIQKQWLAPTNIDEVPSWDDVGQKVLELYERQTKS